MGMFMSYYFPSLPVIAALCLWVTCGAGALAAPALKRAPIAIDADSLEVLQEEGKAIFQGNVVATQDTLTLKASRMSVFYGDGAKNADDGSASALGSLDRIDVEGNVELRTPDESAQSASGMYDAKKNTVFLFGDVTLRRGGNVLHGSRLVYNMEHGKSVLLGAAGGDASAPSSSGRVRGVFVPESQ